jgi:hypothetical protein
VKKLGCDVHIVLSETEKSKRHSLYIKHSLVFQQKIRSESISLGQPPI